MSEPLDDELTPELRRALDSVPAPEADPAFEARLRDRFVGAGKIALEEDRAPGPRTRAWGVVVALAAAAAFLLVLRIVNQPDAPAVDDGGDAVAVASSPWSLLPGSCPDARLGGVDLDTSTEGFLEGLVEGATLETAGSGPLRLKLDDRLVLELAENSRMALASLPGGGSPETLRMTLESGAVRLVTGAGFDGSRLFVDTPDAGVEIVGTELAVDYYPDDGTCVCCTEGLVRVVPVLAPDAAADAAGGRACFVKTDGRMGQMPAIGKHVAPIDDLRAFLDQ